MQPLLKKNGIYISTELGKGGENILFALFTPIFSNKKVLFPIPVIRIEDILYLKSLAEKGLYKPVVDRCFQLSEITEAYRYVETGQKTGNVLLQIAEET